MLETSHNFFSRWGLSCWQRCSPTLQLRLVVLLCVVYLGRHGNWHPVLSNRFVLVQPMPHLSHADDLWLTGVFMLRMMVSIIAVVCTMVHKRISGCEYLFRF